MTYTKWLGAALSLVAVGAIGTTGFARTALAAGANAHATKSTKASIPKRCKTRIKATGTIKYSDWQFPDTLNPYQTSTVVSNETINGMSDGLTTYNGKAKLITDLLTKLPTIKNGGITNGGKTITLSIKKGAQWSNGAQITSRDIWFGWKVGSDPATGPACSGSCDIISRIDTPSTYQAVLHLKSIYAPAIPYALPGLWPVKWAGAWTANDFHSAALKLGQDATYNFENTSYPTNGPYQVTNFVKDDRITLSPMKYYNIFNCGGAIKNLIFAFYSDKSSMIAAAAAKQTDVTQNYTPADLPLLKQHTDAFTLHADAGFTFEHVELNTDATYNGSPNPLANVNVRVALALAVDKIGLVRSALGVSAKQANQVVAWTPLVNTPTLVQPFADKTIKGQWDPIAKKYVNSGTTQATNDAKKLLAKTPFASGFSIDFDTTTGNAVRAAQAGVIQQDWSRIGVKMNLTLVPASKFFADWNGGGTLHHGQFQAGMFAFSGQPDPDQLKYNLVSQYVDRTLTNHASIDANYSGMHDSVFDKGFPAAAHTFNNKARQKAYSAIQADLNKKAYWIPLFFRPQIATSDSKLLGFENNPTQFGPTANMYNWHAKGS